MNNFLIIGGSGLIGSRLIEILTADVSNISATYFSNQFVHKKCETFQLDITDRRAVEELIDSLHPHFVVNVTGERNTRYCERNPGDAYKVNVVGTNNIVDACKAVNAKMILVSSDLVFDGTKGRYCEEDKVNPLIVYGEQKVLAENIIRDNLNEWLIIRASSVYDWNPGKDNFVSWVMEELRNDRKIQIVHDQYVTPLYTGNLVYILIQLLINNKVGIYHAGDGECLNKYDFVKKIAEIFDFNKALIEPISSDELNQNIKIPRDNCLDLTKIKNEIDFSKFSLIDGLKRMQKRSITFQ